MGYKVVDTTVRTAGKRVRRGPALRGRSVRVYGEESGLVLIRIKQTKDFSKARGITIYNELKIHIESIKNKFPDKDNRNLEIGDN